MGVSNYTPGPWRTDHDGYKCGTVEDANGVFSASVVSVSRTTTIANLSLIAAAPDLLAACGAVLAADTGPERDDAAAMVRDAIKRAKGAQ